MRLTKELKQKLINDTKEKLERSKLVLLTNFSGLTVDEDASFRALLRKEKVEYKVIKNTLVKKAIVNTKYEILKDYLQGQTGFVFGYNEDITIPVKVINNFLKKNEKLKIKGGALENKLLNVSEIEQLAKIPSKEQLLAQLLFVLKAPLTNMANCLAAKPREFLNVLVQLKDKKEKETN